MGRRKSRPLQVYAAAQHEPPQTPPSGANFTSNARHEHHNTTIKNKGNEPAPHMKPPSSLSQSISSGSPPNQVDETPIETEGAPLTICRNCGAQFGDMRVEDVREHVQSCLTPDSEGESGSSDLSPPPLDEPPPLDGMGFLPPPYVPRGITLYPERRGEATAGDETLREIRLCQITDVDDFGLENPENLSYSELYQRVENAQKALVAYQNEWMELERYAKGHETQTAGVGKEKEKEIAELDKGRVINPRVPKPNMIGIGYQDQLEAYAYGFEHSAHPNLLGKQNPIKQRYTDDNDVRQLRNRTKSQKATEAGLSTTSESEELGTNGRPKRAAKTTRDVSVDSAAINRNTNFSSRYNSEGPRSRPRKTNGYFQSGKRIGRPPKGIQDGEGAAFNPETSGPQFPGLQGSSHKKSKLAEQYLLEGEYSEGDMRETTEHWDEDEEQQRMDSRRGTPFSVAHSQATGTSEGRQSDGDDSDGFYSTSRRRPRVNTSDFEDPQRPKRRSQQEHAQNDRPLMDVSFDDQPAQLGATRAPPKSRNRSHGAQQGWIKRKRNQLNRTKDQFEGNSPDEESDGSDGEVIYPKHALARAAAGKTAQSSTSALQQLGNGLDSDISNIGRKLSRAELSSKNQKAAWAKDDGTRRQKSSETMKRRWQIAKATGNTTGLVGKSTKQASAKVEKDESNMSVSNATFGDTKKVKREIGQTAASRNMVERWRKKKEADALGLNAPHIGRHKKDKSDVSMTPEASVDADRTGHNTQKRKRVDQDEGPESDNERDDRRSPGDFFAPDPNERNVFDAHKFPRSPLDFGPSYVRDTSALPSEQVDESNGKRQRKGVDENDIWPRSIAEANQRSSQSRSRSKRFGPAAIVEPKVEDSMVDAQHNTIDQDVAQSTKTRSSVRAKRHTSFADQSSQDSIVADSRDATKLETLGIRPTIGKRGSKPNYREEESSDEEGAGYDNIEEINESLTTMNNLNDYSTAKQMVVEGNEQSAAAKNKGGRPRKTPRSSFATQIAAESAIGKQQDTKEPPKPNDGAPALSEAELAAQIKEAKRAAKSAKMSAIAKGRWERGEMDNVAAKRKANNAAKKAAKAAALLAQAAAPASLLATPAAAPPIPVANTSASQSAPDTSGSLRKSNRPRAKSAKSRRALGDMMDGANDSDREQATLPALLIPSPSHPRRKISAYEEFQQLASPLGSPLGRGKRPAALKAKESFSKYGEEDTEQDDEEMQDARDVDARDRDAELEEADVDTEINRQFASEYDHYQALASPGNVVILGKRLRKPVVNLKEAMAIEAGELDDDEFED